MKHTVTWKIGGEAGFGIMTTGLMFSRLATRHGYTIFDYAEYPSLIRGGHNVYEVCVGKEVFSQEKGVDILIALNAQTISLHQSEVKDGGLILYDPDHVTIDELVFKDRHVDLYPMPFEQMTTAAGISKLMVNNVVLGASAGLLSMELDTLRAVIDDSFGKKSGDIADANKQAAQIGYDYVKAHPSASFSHTLPRIGTHEMMVISANESVVLGAVAAGCQLYAAYPMTPSSAALHYFAALAEKYSIVVKHVEDEIAAINLAVGAGYTGVRAMTGTSGGGFSLMVEGLGLAGITETPVVILMGQRPGPATGLPTWTGQADLKFLIHASQDEFPRFVLAPGDIDEAFYLTMQAFNLSEKYQTPVFVLTDKYIGEGHQSVPIFDPHKVPIDRGEMLTKEEGDTVTSYLRYRVTDSGISKRAFPGMKNAVFTANSYEHDQFGLSTEEAKDRVDQVDKRNRKISSYYATFPHQSVYGDDDADITILAWGSTKCPVLEAMKRLKEEGYGHTVNFLHITHVWPFPEKQVAECIKKAKLLFLIEGNSQAQLGSLIKEFTGMDIKNKYLRYDGRPFYPEDIMDRIKELCI